MIFDTIQEWPRYAGLGPRFFQAFQYLESLNAQAPLGRHELDGDNLYAMVQSVTMRSLDQCPFEAHREYADIQFILSGVEIIQWSPVSKLNTVTTPYAAAKDVEFFAAPARPTELILEPGLFAVFFPTDGHAPCGSVNGAGEVRKVVVKVRLDR